MTRGDGRPPGAAEPDGLAFERVDAADARARELMGHMASHVAALYAGFASSTCREEEGPASGAGDVVASGAGTPEGGHRGDVDPQVLRPPWGVFLLGVIGEVAVACGGVRPVPHRPGRAELKRIWVEPAWQRRGVGRRLLAELESFAREAGYEELWLETGPRNRAALALYAAAGYEPIEPFGDNPPDWQVLAFGKVLRERRSGARRTPVPGSGQPAAARTSSGAIEP